MKYWMKRFDLVIASALTLLGAFVTREALAIRSPVGSQRNASFGIARVDTASFPADSVASTRRPAAPVPAPPAPAPVRRPAANADVRERIELSAQDTYIHDVIASHDSALARWPDRAGNPLRVWVQPSARHEGFDSAIVPVVRRAFVEWADVGIPVPFTFVLDSSVADVRVTWVDRFAESISGKTLWAHDDDWWIVEANIVLAVHHRGGEPLDSSAVRAIALHEVGHLIGLDHTQDSANIMTPKVRVKELSAADRATARLIYTVPPGRVK